MVLLLSSRHDASYLLFLLSSVLLVKESLAQDDACTVVSSANDLSNFREGVHSFCTFDFAGANCGSHVTIPNGATTEWECHNSGGCTWTLKNESCNGHVTLGQNTNFSMRGNFLLGGAFNAFSIEQSDASSLFLAKTVVWKGNPKGSINCAGNVTLEETQFLDNGIITEGVGGIRIQAEFSTQANVEIKKSTFARNTGFLGGAILLGQGKSLTISECQFINNTSIAGAAINVQDNVELTISSSSFVGNKAEEEGGGAILLEPYSPTQPGYTTTISDSNFTANVAPIYGGAIYSIGGLVLKNCNFKANVAAQGGMIYSAVSQGSNVTGACEGIVEDNVPCNGVFLDNGTCSPNCHGGGEDDGPGLEEVTLPPSTSKASPTFSSLGWSGTLLLVSRSAFSVLLSTYLPIA